MKFDEWLNNYMNNPACDEPRLTVQLKRAWDAAEKNLKPDGQVQLEQRVSQQTALRKFVDDEMTEIDKDERFHYKPATVFENAPLAMIQVAMETRMQLLKEFKSRLSG